MAQTFEQVGEKFPADMQIEELIYRLTELRKERGEKLEAKEAFPDLTLEKQQLADANESIFQQVKDAAEKVFDFLIVRPAKWIGRQIKEHPFRTALIALAAFALWYYSAPLSAGLSGIKEQGIAITSDLLGEGLNIDPTQVDIFDQLINTANGAPAGPT